MEKIVTAQNDKPTTEAPEVVGETNDGEVAETPKPETDKDGLYPATGTDTPKRSINQRQQRNLEKVLRDDYSTARDDLMKAKNDALRDLSDKYSEKSRAQLKELTEGEEIKALAKRAAKKVNKILKDLREAVEAEGFALTAGYSSHPDLEVTVSRNQRTLGVNGISSFRISIPKLDEETEQIQRDIEVAYNEAYAVLNRSEREANRKILLAGIDSADAMELVKSIPDPKTVLAEAFAQKPPAIEA